MTASEGRENEGRECNPGLRLVEGHVVGWESWIRIKNVNSWRLEEDDSV